MGIFDLSNFGNSKCQNNPTMNCLFCPRLACDAIGREECLACMENHYMCALSTGTDFTMAIIKLKENGPTKGSHSTNTKKKHKTLFCLKCEDKVRNLRFHSCKKDNSKDWLDVLKDIKVKK